eukprot:GHVS01040331.1.p1 GENE.GHVS01040331.1~~GHVS01040331.1.p1  ORF type:complete len:227 (+),score=17.74 GHVS01040331.1:178-858(+)
MASTPCIKTATGEVLPTPVQVMVDTGSSMNRIRKAALELLQRSCRSADVPELRVTDEQKGLLLTGVTNDRMAVEGTEYVQIVLKGITLLTPCAIVDRCPSQILLGVPALRAHQLVPDVVNECLYFMPKPDLHIQMRTALPSKREGIVATESAVPVSLPRLLRRLAATQTAALLVATRPADQSARLGAACFVATTTMNAQHPCVGVASSSARPLVIRAGHVTSAVTL